jgi:hypothetical protein
MEMYGRELSNNQLNKIFYNESSETKEIENNSFTNYKVWEKNCLRNYDDCKSLGYKSKYTREEFEEEIKQIIMKQLYKTYQSGMGLIL